MLIPEIAPYIMDNSNCNSHGKDIYMQLVEYVSYHGEYDKDTNTFSITYVPDRAEYTTNGLKTWHCKYCDHLIKWVGHPPQVVVE